MPALKPSPTKYLPETTTTMPSTTLPPQPFRTPRSEFDCQYKIIKLGNGLKALLVSDTQADKAAASLDVRNGSFADGDINGIMHFLEHMLFYSSSKYPEEDAYSKFISQHGGKTNAYTANESTNYHFDVNPEHLEPALDRFAQFFIAPLISADGVEREAQAVDSEHKKNLNIDGWRRYELWKHTSNKQHVFSRFATGDFSTLIEQPTKKGLSPHSLVKEWYERHYSAALMKLAVVGPHSLDDLEAMVVSKLSMIPADPSIKAVTVPRNAVTPDNLGKLIKVVPIKDHHTVEINFPTPVSEVEHYNAAPMHYISHLVGHEGEGSVFSLLRQKGWATGLVAGEANTSFSNQSFFMCQVDLTEQGNIHVKEVVAIIFAYIHMLKHNKDGVSEGIWGEVRGIADLKFDYRDKPSPYSMVTSLTVGMQVYEDEHLLEALHGVPLEYDASLIHQALDALVPENARIMWSSKLLEEECGEVEPVYQSKYSLSAIPQDWLDAIGSSTGSPSSSNSSSTGSTIEGLAELSLPKPNPFIPQNLDMITEHSKTAEKAVDDDRKRLWHQPNPSFKTPKAVAMIHIHLNEAYASPEKAVMSKLHCLLVSDVLTEVAYPASLAGLHYRVSSTAAGFMVALSGFSDALPRLMQCVLNKVFCKTISKDRFDIMKEKLAREYLNHAFDQPYNQAVYEMAVALEAKRWHMDSYKQVLPFIGLSDLSSFISNTLFHRTWTEMFLTGNVTLESTLDIAGDLEGRLAEEEGRKGALPLLPSQRTECRVVKVPAGQATVYVKPGTDPNNDNSAVMVCFQVGPDNDLQANALCELLVHVAKREAFYQLRTVEQLGYLTWCFQHSTVTVKSICFLIQSSAHSAGYLESRISAFLPVLLEKLTAMTEEEFEKHKEQLAVAKLEEPKKLREAAERSWREIDDGTLRFERQRDEVEALKDVSREQLIDFYKCHVLDHEMCRRFSVRIEATKKEEEEEGGGSNEKKEGVEQASSLEPSFKTWMGGNVHFIKDVFEWKRGQDLFASSR